MTRKQIDASRELRLWIGQVIVPAVTAGMYLISNPNTKQTLETAKEKVIGVIPKFKKNKD